MEVEHFAGVPRARGVAVLLAREEAEGRAGCELRASQPHPLGRPDWVCAARWRRPPRHGRGRARPQLLCLLAATCAAVRALWGLAEGMLAGEMMTACQWCAGTATCKAMPVAAWPYHCSSRSTLNGAHRLLDEMCAQMGESLVLPWYIVILDDIWTSSAWENIRCVFPDNEKGSRIIVTTRNEDVANTCCCHSQDRIYKIQRLSEIASRELFFKRIFGLVDGLPNNELEEVSNVILKKCGGLPLAIVSIGSLLASKPNRTKQEWQKVSDNLGSELEINPTLEGTKLVLSLSYNDLPYHLKACFLYLSIFPQNYVIKRGPLVRMWIAEGFVTAKHGLSMEEVAERYFDEFVARSMVHPVKIDWSGKVRSCRVHDIMVEVIMSKSLEENFASYFCENGTTLDSHDKIRRLFFQSSSHLVQRTSASVAHVRTFRMSPSMEEIPFFFAHLRLLRVLDMQGSSCLSNKDLDCICNFFQLKYLSLRNTSISKLPRFIGHLNYLETLDIRETLIKKLPSSAKSLVRLKHLLVGHKTHLTRTGSVKSFRRSSGLEMTPGVLMNMASLQSVCHIEIKKDPSVFQEISLLRNLKKLNVLFHGVEVNWKPCLESLSNLPGSVRSLSIQIFDGDGSISSEEMLSSVESPPLLVTSFGLTGKLERLPLWAASLRNVSTFTLRNNGLHADAIDVLGDLPSLLCLKLYHKSYADDCLIFPQGKFLKVKLLVIDNLENIDKVCFKDGSVPCLERLTLSFLREPKHGISGLENLLKLKEIEFFGNIYSYRPLLGARVQAPLDRRW
ncbi:disease resistance protein Pik-2 isoform X2 [Triticum aestivum]|uniref:disease resistance protein Pik-2 isoform X2 n=1 Tax=Triticum aestivum TaxID=4565 RepID=UPI001D024E21|nr:disease resistance protein Pik-2-like isoform X2 [Triticum aestivum]